MYLLYGNPIQKVLPHFLLKKNLSVLGSGCFFYGNGLSQYLKGAGKAAGEINK